MLVFRISITTILFWICLEFEVEACNAEYFSRQRPNDLFIIVGKGVEYTFLGARNY